MSGRYTGDVSSRDCWTSLSEDPDSFLIDVRTTKEWETIGVPQLEPSMHEPLFQEWQTFPTMQVDPNFAASVAEAVAAAGGSKASKLYFLCRSGARSQGAAAALTEAGFSQSFNVLDGFEGPPDGTGQRGSLAGWQADGLPWTKR
ncbi:MULTISPECIES: rhodanese-like domain-containing protein [unclassified Aureimonas]|uniref:rhodanese-like domain-containing protein n=1 Tax=unclassified Aureimonas TaxID=2615206 RepID=UPI0007019E2B|nr:MULTISPECIES: rhodanese-like domain-containing protein [unclassified Aureimonas]KQT64532.1 sulfurtransferase [Aureimonas sp. Leaf427]KQT81717.1 sulfurtransferase [Aureimonas sp. Leaf460]